MIKATEAVAHFTSLFECLCDIQFEGAEWRQDHELQRVKDFNATRALLEGLIDRAREGEDVKGEFLEAMGVCAQTSEEHLAKLEAQFGHERASITEFKGAALALKKDGDQAGALRELRRAKASEAQLERLLARREALLKRGFHREESSRE